MTDVALDNRNTDIFRVGRAGELQAAPGQTLNARRISGVSKEDSAKLALRELTVPDPGKKPSQTNRM
jgi:hypothetical protein